MASVFHHPGGRVFDKAVAHHVGCDRFATGVTKSDNGHIRVDIEVAASDDLARGQPGRDHNYLGAANALDIVDAVIFAVNLGVYIFIVEYLRTADAPVSRTEVFHDI